MLVTFQTVESVFSKSIQKLPCQESTKAYISNVFNSANKENCDYSNESVTLIYSRAKFEYRFELFQNLADWILFSKTLFPQSLNGASGDYYQAIAQDSYYKCYKMINRKWLLFEELADRFPIVVDTLRTTEFDCAGPLQVDLLSLSVRT